MRVIMCDWCFSPKQPEISRSAVTDGTVGYGWAMQTLAGLVGRKDTSSSCGNRSFLNDFGLFCVQINKNGRIAW